MITSLSDNYEFYEMILNRMRQHEEMLKRLENAGLSIEEQSFQRGCICELRYVKNMLELRYL